MDVLGTLILLILGRQAGRHSSPAESKFGT